MSTKSERRFFTQMAKLKYYDGKTWITPDADTVDGRHANNTANNLLILDSAGKVDNSKLYEASTSTKGIIQLNNSTNSTSITQAATAASVKAAYDKANHSHPYLSTSGGTVTGDTTFNKNVNANSIKVNDALNGNISISGGKIINSFKDEIYSHQSTIDTSILLQTTGDVTGGGQVTNVTNRIAPGFIQIKDDNRGNASQDCPMVEIFPNRITLSDESNSSHSTTIRNYGIETNDVNAKRIYLQNTLSIGDKGFIQYNATNGVLELGQSDGASPVLIGTIGMQPKQDNKMYLGSGGARWKEVLTHGVNCGYTYYTNNFSSDIQSGIANAHGDGAKSLTLRVNGKMYQFTDDWHGFHPYSAQTPLGTEYLPWGKIFSGSPSLGENGFSSLTNGLILAWGITYIKVVKTQGVSSEVTVNLPITMPSTILCVQATCTRNTTWGNYNSVPAINASCFVKSNSQIVVTAMPTTTLLQDFEFAISWMVIGK